MRASLRTAVGMLALAAGSAAFGQTVGGDQPVAGATQPSRTTTYDAAFFSGFAPRTALDIARRVPGFSLEIGDSDVRGFGQAAGNVVINGARPSSKAETLEDTLARIPASSVVRVEVGAGDLYGAEYSSKSQVLNVIVSAAGGLEGNVTGSVRRIHTGRLVPNGSASATIQRGPSAFNISTGWQRTFEVDEGTDKLVDADTGEVIETRRKINPYNNRNPFLSGSWALERSPTDAIRLNGRFARGHNFLEQRNRVTPAGGDPHDDTLITDYRNPVFEIGGDITRPLAGGAIKLVGLATRRKRDYFDAYYSRDGLRTDNAEVVGGFEQTQDAQRNETIGRLTWNHQNLAGFSVELGGEAVLNTLDSNVELFGIRPDGTRTRIDLPIDSAVVKEKRGEAFVKLGRSLSPGLRVDGGLTYEYSDLTVRGDTTEDRTLRFFKPNMAVDWKPGGGWHTRLSITRTVAQLDFYDFISAAELSNSRVNGGNANLVPQRSWEFRFTADRPLLGDGLFKLDLGRDQISLLQDRVLIFGEDGSAFDAPGNIGTGQRTFASLTLDAPLGRLWTGLRAKFEGTVQRTRVDDPITGKPRNFSGFYPDWEWLMDLRRDAGAWSYGLTVSDRDRFTFFRTDEFDIGYNGSLYGKAFVEYRPDPRTAVTMDFDNLFDTTSRRLRLLSFPNRAQADERINESRVRNRHLSVGVTLKRTFGGAGKATAPAGE